MFSAIITFFLGLTGTLPMATPVELASYTKCQPDRISHWIGQRISYEHTKGWESAETCMARGIGDCKCMGVVAQETINSCVGMDAWIIILKNETGSLHAVTFFRDHTAGIGFINGIIRKQFPPETDWRDIVADISGGPWTIIEQRHASNHPGDGTHPFPQGSPAPPASVAAEPETVMLGNVAEDPIGKSAASQLRLPAI
jgi:hypothetical protein